MIQPMTLTEVSLALRDAGQWLGVSVNLEGDLMHNGTRIGKVRRPWQLELPDGQLRFKKTPAAAVVAALTWYYAGREVAAKAYQAAALVLGVTIKDDWTAEHRGAVLGRIKPGWGGQWSATTAAGTPRETSGPELVILALLEEHYRNPTPTIVE